MRRARLVRAILLATLALAAGCTTNQVGVLPSASPANIAAATLQFAVGTATIAESNGGSFVGLNLVATYRQSNGEPATLINTPTLSGPADFSAGTTTPSNN